MLGCWCLVLLTESTVQRRTTVAPCWRALCCPLTAHVPSLLATHVAHTPRNNALLKAKPVQKECLYAYDDDGRLLALASQRPHTPRHTSHLQSPVGSWEMHPKKRNKRTQAR